MSASDKTTAELQAAAGRQIAKWVKYYWREHREESLRMDCREPKRKDFAALVGLSFPALSNILNNQRDVAGFGVLLRLRDAFGADAERVLKRDPPETGQEPNPSAVPPSAQPERRRSGGRS